MCENETVCLVFHWQEETRVVNFLTDTRFLQQVFVFIFIIYTLLVIYCLYFNCFPFPELS